MKLELIKNGRDFTNEKYGVLLDYFLSLRSLLEKIILVHEPDYEVEIIEGFTREEAISLEFIDDIEQITWAEYNKLAEQIAVEMYFPSSGCTSLFIDVMEDMKFNFNQLQAKINCMQSYNFAEDFKQDFKRDLDNLTYCILSSFRMFSVYSGKITSAMKEYCAVKKVDPIEFIDKLNDYYTQNRPTLVLFEKYPELAKSLESKISKEYFETIVGYSSLIKRAELEKIAKGELEVDDSYIDELAERMEEVKAGGVN